MFLRRGCLLLLVLLAACQRDAAGPQSTNSPPLATYHTEEIGPPSPFDFGSDTYRTGLFTGAGTTRPRLDCQASSAEARMCTGFLASEVDGALLDVSMMIPHSGGPHPLVVLLHGWGGSRSSSGDIADALIADGYAVLRYSARGFGRSWGQVNLSDVHVELADLRSMIGQIVDQPGYRINADAVAVTGASYGGGQSWLALLHPTFTSPRGTAVRIRTVVPIVPWSDLLYSLIPNGRPERSVDVAGSLKLSYVNALYFSGIRTSLDRPYPNYPEYLVAWHGWMNAIEPNRLDPMQGQIVDGLAGYRSIWWQQSFWQQAARNRVPIFQVQGFTDDLFPLSEAKRMLLALKTIDPSYPIASYFGDIGHPRASNKAAEVDYLLGLIRQWLAYYLHGSGAQPAHVIYAAITRPRDQAFSAADVISVPTYHDLASAVLTKQFDNSVVLINPLSDPYSGFYWDPLVMEAARELQPYTLPPPEPAIVENSVGVFEVDVAELSTGGSILIAGQPAIFLRASTLAPRVQLNVRLIDVAPDGRRQLITRGTYMLEMAGSVPGEAADVMILTYGNLWEAAGDHRLRVEITNLDSPYITPSRIPSATAISAVRLELPVR